jgi:hypothetical protein
MSRALVMSVLTALCCLGAGIGAFVAGRAGGPDLAMVRLSATHAGEQSGVREGSSAGRLAGFRAGYRAGYHHAYPTAYRIAYRRALER